jgi:hypothetical protein
MIGRKIMHSEKAFILTEIISFDPSHREYNSKGGLLLLLVLILEKNIDSRHQATIWVSLFKTPQPC